MASSKPQGEVSRPDPKPQAPNTAALQSNSKPATPVFTDYASI